MICAGYLNVALKKPQTGQVKFKISLDTGQAKFSLLKGKKIHSVGRVSLALLRRGVYIANAIWIENLVHKGKNEKIVRNVKE